MIATEDVLQQLVFWSVGSLARADWEKVLVLAIALAVVMPLSFASSGKMTALRMGENAPLVSYRCEKAALFCVATDQCLVGHGCSIRRNDRLYRAGWTSHCAATRR